MLADLDMAIHTSRDVADASVPALAVCISSGKQGRPKVVIAVGLLREGSRLGTNKELADYVSCHPRTICRRKLEAGLEQQGRPVCTFTKTGDSSQVMHYQGPARTMSEINDNDLDSVIARLLQDMPGFGCRMVEGALQALGLQIPQRRVRESLLCVQGVPGVFGDRRIHRCEYRVAGPNSLWHHDGQHGTCLLSLHHILLTRS
jgi:hypothetical protein